MSIEWNSNKHAHVTGWAWFGVVFYVFIVPACIGLALWMRRDEITSRKTRSGGQELTTLGFLFRNYREELSCSMPVIDLYRRLALSRCVLTEKRSISHVILIETPRV